MTKSEERGQARKAIGRNLRRHMRERGLSQAALADSIGTSQGHVCHLTQGEKMPTALTAKRIALALGCTVDELLEGVE